MGHGCAVFVESPSGRTMLYDAGQMGAPATGARTISEFLWDRGLTHLDAVVLSHPDIDHYDALPALLEKFSVGAVYVSPVMFAKENRTIKALRQAIEQHGVPVHEVRAGDRLWADDVCSVEVLHPPDRGIAASGNANSLVVAVEYRGRRIVLPGDLESPGLDDMLAGKPRPCEVLMAPHHGSRKSNSPGLAAWCKPRWVVFSGDGRWNLPEIDAVYRAVGGQSLQTHDCGAIRVQIDGRGVRVSQFVEPR
jgi:competence protein ComEC